MPERTVILGGGITGLAVGLASGAPVYEARQTPGGICSSYYIRPGSSTRLPTAPEDGEAYRFEIGGGHWIFGGDPAVLAFIESLTPMRRYNRQSAVFLPALAQLLPYPLQYALRDLPADTIKKALAEISRPAGPIVTMEDWLREHFGETLGALFFTPFHQLYTAGLFTRIAPQDAYKSPIDPERAREGAKPGTQTAGASVGYNTSYLYPADGLDSLARALAERCPVTFGKRAQAIDLPRKTVRFADGSAVAYDRLVSTLPLNRTLEMAGLAVASEVDPHSSVLVLNIGARKGKDCPKEHWIYVPESSSGFHRVGFYSNVDRHFTPHAAQAAGQHASLYVERSFPGSQRPGRDETQAYCASVVRELQDWGFIEEAEAVDPTWIDVAYTWSLPASRWREEALAALGAEDVIMVGRYARWTFQGIADSLRDGLAVGATLRE